jgi:hypothetical protein
VYCRGNRGGMFRILHLNTKRDQIRSGLVWFLVAIVSTALLT